MNNKPSIFIFLWSRPGVTLVCFIAGISGLIISLYLFSRLKIPETERNSPPLPLKTLPSEVGNVFVDLEGAVTRPGVYRVAPESRVSDILEQAGGVLPQANKKFLKESINLAKKVSDEEKIYIPFSSEVNPNLPQEKEIRINSFSKEELTLAGVTDSKFITKILSLRPFTSLEDFKKRAKPSSTFMKQLGSQLSFLTQ